MFEDSLVESQSAPISTAKQWTTLSSIAIQTATAALLIAFPLLQPEQFPLPLHSPRVLLPLPPKPRVKIKPSQVSTKSVSATLPSVLETAQPAGTHLPGPNPESDPEEPLAPFSGGNQIWSASGLPDALLTATTSRMVSTTPVHRSTPLKISGGVSAGIPLSPIRPVYPAIARATQTEGTVVVEAIISRSGTIESLRILSGPEMLRQAAMDAIRTARYQPYRLNGEPIEVQTTITVNFRLNG